MAKYTYLFHVLEGFDPLFFVDLTLDLVSSLDEFPQCCGAGDGPLPKSDPLLGSGGVDKQVC